MPKTPTAGSAIPRAAVAERDEPGFAIGAGAEVSLLIWLDRAVPREEDEAGRFGDRLRTRSLTKAKRRRSRAREGIAKRLV